MATEVRSLSRLRGRAGEGVLPQMHWSRGWTFPHPPRSGAAERVDLPRKRER
jgi:hypothetical protein